MEKASRALSGLATLSAGIGLGGWLLSESLYNGEWAARDGATSRVDARGSARAHVAGPRRGARTDVRGARARFVVSTHSRHLRGGCPGYQRFPPFLAAPRAQQARRIEGAGTRDVSIPTQRGTPY